MFQGDLEPGFLFRREHLSVGLMLAGGMARTAGPVAIVGLRFMLFPAMIKELRARRRRGL